MTMSNPYAPDALASTMGPTQSAMPPLVLAPDSLAQGVDLGQQAPTLAQPGPVNAPLPPPTIADPAAMASVPPPNMSMAPNAAMDASGPVPDASAMPPPAAPPPPPDANMTSGATGAPVAAPAPETPPAAPPAEAPAEGQAAPAAKPAPRITPAGRVDPALAQLSAYNQQISDTNAARNVTEAGYADRTAQRTKEIEDIATNAATVRNVQNSVDSYHAAQQQEFDAKANAQTQKELADIQRISQEVGAMKVDPKKALPQGVAGGILGVIGAALGGASSALVGGPNQFTAMMNHAMEMQMRADEANIANAKSGLSNKISLYGLMRQELGDARAAKVAFRKAAWDHAENQLNALKEKTTNKAQIQKFDDLTMEIEKNRLNEQLQFAQGRKAELVGAMTADQAARAAAEQKAWDRSVEMQKLDIERRKAGAEAKKGQYAANAEERAARGTWSQGMQGYTSNPDQVKEGNKVATQSANALTAIQRLRDLANNNWTSVNPESMGKIQQAARGLIMAEKDRNELGVLTESDMSQMPISIDEITDIFRQRQWGALDELEQTIKRGRANWRNNNIALNPDGTPNAEYTGKGFSYPTATYTPASLENTGKKK